MAPRLDRSKWVAKTQAKTLFCLKDSELEGLECEERPNPRARRGPPMKLFQKEQLERAAIAKWGSLAALEAERERRQQLREQRSIASYFSRQQQEGQEGEQLGDASEAGEGTLGEGARGQQGSRQQQGSPGAAPHQGQQEGPQDMHVDSAHTGGEQAPAQQGQRGQQARPAPHGPAWLQSLPPLLRERVCIVPRQAQQAGQAGQARQALQVQQAGQTQQAGQAGQPAGSYVLYWMKTAVRGHENPALDAAAAAAASLGLPLLAAAFLLASHPYASARRWEFLLEGLRDAQAELRGQGVELLVYVEGLEDAAHAAEGQGAAAAGGGTADAGADAGAGGAAALAGRAAADPYSPSFSFHPPPSFRQTAGWQALLRLASGAALVVTEDVPVPPDADWLLAVAEQLPAQVPVVAVDTACVLPMRLVKKCHEKAYAFRSATEAQRKQRIARTYQLAPGAPPVGPAALAPPPAALAGLPPLPLELLSREHLGWAPLELAGIPPPHLPQRLAALLARCAIDHSVPCVAHMRGGSAAGYARWEAFRKKGLSLYAARRNDPMVRDGTSRLSAYHHWGMVSPFKVAREAALDRSAGAAKFLDEFLIWREIGFNLCLHRHAQLHSLAALPQWARDTLERHAGDPRPATLAYDRLEAGQTGDAWWDAAQRQLVKTGELHNWSRMTWGKAFLGWAPTPQAALSAALHANHRWALDGCDPASYAGVLWCFGMYDAPKASAETPISGCLAGKSTAAAARRLPPAAYAALPP